MCFLTFCKYSRVCRQLHFENESVFELLAPRLVLFFGGKDRCPKSGNPFVVLLTGLAKLMEGVGWGIQIDGFFHQHSLLFGLQGCEWEKYELE